MVGKKTKEKATTIGEQLVAFVVQRYEYSKKNMTPRFAQWRKYYKSYRGTRTKKKEWWQSNYAVTSLKEAIRTKIPIYMNILFSAGLKSFDIKPREETDEEVIPSLKSIIQFQLANVARRKGGFFAQAESFIKQFEMYGYSQSKVIWEEEVKDGKTIFDGNDIETLDIFSTFPDPGVLNINESWIILEMKDKFVSYLRMQQALGNYHSIKDLKDTSQNKEGGTLQGDEFGNERVDLLEYHGEVPKKLLEGEMYDPALADPYDDEYVKAIITIGNQRVCIRNDKYPYKASTIFCDASKDKMPNEQFGVGTGEDIFSYSRELNNAHNKFSDCVNIIANPCAVINGQKMAGMSGGIILTHPGRVFTTNPNVDDVTKAMYFINTTAQAAALSPLIVFIKMLEGKIEKTTQAVPVISAVPTKEGLPETLGATKMMQGNAIEPLKHIVKHTLEPWFVHQLEIMYEHNVQFFSKESAYRVLGKEKAQIWFEDKESKDILAKDLKLSGNIDFISRGVSIFEEQQQMIQNLLLLLKIAPTALEAAISPNGEIQTGEDGQSVMKPVFDMGAIGKKIGEHMRVEDLEELIPSLRDKREREEFKAEQQAKIKKDKKIAEIPSSATSSKGSGQVISPLTGTDLVRMKGK